LQRQAIKQWLQAQEKAHPGRTDNIFLGVQSVTPSHLADRLLFDFVGLIPSHQPEPEGDTLFDSAGERGALHLSHAEGRHLHFVKAGNFARMKD
jgi:tRNA 2-thiocytidine biosynthesis protein TtcA